MSSPRETVWITAKYGRSPVSQSIAAGWHKGVAKAPNARRHLSVLGGSIPPSACAEDSGQ